MASRIEFKYPELEAKIAETNTPKSKVAKEIGIGYTAFYRKRIGESDWLSGEIIGLRKLFGWSKETAGRIFL